MTLTQKCTAVIIRSGQLVEAHALILPSFEEQSLSFQNFLLAQPHLGPFYLQPSRANA